MMTAKEFLDMMTGISMIFLFLFGIPIIVMVIGWFIIDPSTAIERALAIIVCGVLGLTAFMGFLVIEVGTR
jgi:Sec-independent protein secretion pathway component TatC